MRATAPVERTGAFAVGRPGERCTATFGPDHCRTTEARALLDRIDRA
ncbi:hypothetical protein ABZ307_32660 [Streptomyces griseorubiginosus]